jgi:cytoplasmic iron level regulating protein YaaA (DUF328/UPF0246 family)
MKILFSPSETKYKGGDNIKLNKNSFIFPSLYDNRIEILNRYNDYINNATNDQLKKLFGTKKQDIVDYYKGDIFSKPLEKAIKRYDGVAYDYLKYNELEKIQQDYIDKNLLIFSNLFGILNAGDIGIPDYKLKQGEKIDGFVVEKYYNTKCSKIITEYLENEPIVDLRAGFYEKFYKITKPYTTMKFTKDGKVVSHWAKAYRGIVVNLMAKNNIKTTEELMNMQIPNLKIEEIKQTKLKSEIVYSII